MGPGSQNRSPTITSVLLKQLLLLTTNSFIAFSSLVCLLFLSCHHLLISFPSFKLESQTTGSFRMQGELERTSVWCYVSKNITIPSSSYQLIPDPIAEFAVQVQLYQEYQELKHAYENALSRLIVRPRDLSKNTLLLISCLLLLL